MPRPPSPVPSCVSMKSDKSIDHPPNISPQPLSQTSKMPRPPSPVPSCVSMKSDKSIDHPPNISPQPLSHTHTAEPGAVLCAVCPKRAFKSCRTCMASFCGDHVKPHYTAPALQRHRLVEATEDLELMVCQRHNREMDLYCNTDQTAICALCVGKTHMGHDVIELGEHQVHLH
ncbi:tripartite motif-containing protein 29-like [Engraulis encrasicolus]|uniref:tripartite motif-containing protein 29-like n=1 Tax=Engraulis encrasicolus TaxID=184585 RepID=UPI002FD71A88